MTSFDWVKQDYTPVFLERAQRLDRLRKDASILPGLKEYYKTNPVAFITDWGMTVDPRNAEVGKETTMPFILFPKQEEFIQWLYDRWKAREDGLAEKSRDMGVSWLCVAFAVWMWVFYPGTVIGFGSRKEEYVDKLGDPKSLFWKARKFINLLPLEFKPNGYDEKRHAPSMRIVNPENESAIVGEAGDNIGRGNRTAIYFKDESAFYERADAIDAALSQTSNCKIDVSTPNGNGNPFFRKRFGGRIPVFSFNWRSDPRKNEAWYKKQCETLDPVIVAQEIDIDYAASVSNAWISADLVSAAQRFGPADVTPMGGWFVGVDAAHEGNDESVITFRRGRLVLPQIRERKLDGPNLARIVEARLDDILTRNSGQVAAIVIELDGPGVSCYDQLKLGRYANQTYGIHTGARLSDGRNLNIRAQLWARGRAWLEEPPVSMPLDGELRSQIASMKYKYKDGLLQMQDKREYKKDYGRSPDCFVAGTLVKTNVGEVSIEDIRVGDKVLTPFGYRDVIKTWETETDAITKISLSNGTTLEGKGKHRIFTQNRGFVRMDALVCTDYIETYSYRRILKWMFQGILYIKGKNSAFKAQVDTIRPSICWRMKDVCIGEYGQSITALSRLSMISTMLTEIGVITRLQILSVFTISTTKDITCLKDTNVRSLQRKTKFGLIGRERHPQSGTEVLKAGRGTLRTGKRRGLGGSRTTVIAKFVENLSRHSIPHWLNGALKSVYTLIITSITKTTKGIVCGAKRILSPFVIENKNVVRLHAAQNCVGQKTKTYNLTLDRDNVYYANGVLVDNCADSWVLTFYNEVEPVSVFNPQNSAHVASYNPLSREYIAQDFRVYNPFRR